MPRSWERDTDNLRNWTEGTGSVSRKETTYLETEEDLANLTGSADLAMSFSESVVEDCVIYLDGLISRVCKPREHPSPSVVLMTLVSANIDSLIVPAIMAERAVGNHRRRSYLAS